MKLVFRILIVFVLSFNINAREQGETEITTEDGIEVFQDKKYYLLKKNVKIISDNFSLEADDVKINFDKSLYDITELNAKGNVKFNSPEFEMRGIGQSLQFEVKIEKFKVEGQNSILITKDTEMYSDGFIEINNTNGDFKLYGPKSELNNEDILIKAYSINGKFSNNNDQKDIILLNVNDEKIAYVKNNDNEMYAKKINYNKVSSFIELIDEVLIIRNGEKISGDYGTVDTKNNSYKIKSNNQKKVKVIIQNNE